MQALAASSQKTNRWDAKNWSPGKVTLFQAMGLGSWPISYPKLTPQLPGQANVQSGSGAGGTGGGPGNTSSVSTGGASGMRGVYNALRSVGASPVQAVGLIANALAESGLDPEAVGDGGTSFGLWQFHEPSYPGAHGLVTGHPANDLVAQIRFLVSHGGLGAASGSTASQVAGNFASNFERCTTCQPGGSSYQQRISYVAQIEGKLGIKG